MSEPNKNLESDAPLAALESWFQGLIREEIQANQNGHGESKLLTPEELADRLQVPRS